MGSELVTLHFGMVYSRGKLALTRLYLRMLISIPGDPLRRILRYGDKRIEEANASQYNTVSSNPSKQETQVSFSCFKLMSWS